jgi:hypothetical protein
MGPRSSALVGGYSSLHRQLEQELARLKGTQDCLLFPTGEGVGWAGSLSCRVWQGVGEGEGGITCLLLMPLMPLLMLLVMRMCSQACRRCPHCILLAVAAATWLSTTTLHASFHVP